jgi:gliding motility-associated-like protein
MKKLGIFVCVLLMTSQSFAAHVVGGEMTYQYLGPGTSANTKTYRINLRLFRDQNGGGAAFPGSSTIGVYNGNGVQFGGFITANIDIAGGSPVGVNTLPPCITNAPNLSYNVANYDFTIELPDFPTGYNFSYQACCRINNMANVFSPAGTGGTGSTYTCHIPGTAEFSGNNSSPQFNTNISVVCFNRNFTFDFSAEDSDADSLVYSFCDAYGGGASTGSVFGTPAPPPFASVPYINGFNGSSPLGPTATINAQTGIVSGVAPPPIPGFSGKYLVGVCAKEYRNGVYIGEHRKDFILNIADCDYAGAQLEPTYTSCDGFTLNFVNLNNSPLNQTYFWDFGVPSLTNDTSNLPNPTFTYPDTGIYVIKLAVNRGLECPDSTNSIVRVYPGFFPGFIHTGACYTSPIQFNDTSVTRYGAVNSWRWDFGDNATLADTSRLKNPSYTYSTPGVKTVTLTVGSNKGCSKTVIKDITVIDKPVVNTLFKDTLICSIDTLQLNATTSSGTVLWTPNYRILNTTSLTPLVYPQVTTWYKITANDQGCKNEDSVRVRVKDFVTVDIMPDTAICFTDAIILRTVSDGTSFRWDNAATLNNPNIKEPTARPLVPTTYTLVANLGKCEARDFVRVIGSDYPFVNAGPDTTICFGFEGQLFGVMGGVQFNWSPLTGLVNPTTLTPIAKPVRTTRYVLTTTGTQYCPKPARDTVLVTVIPRVVAFAGRDTSIVSGQPLQLNGSGASNYLWTPSTGLSNPNIQNPIAILNQNQSYQLRAFTNEGCFDTDSINITVFKTAPDIFVPTAFSPNGDGLNDILLPIPVGLKGYDFFEVYNRWGVRMFSTTQIGRGWDGKYRNVPQDSDTFVWVVQGTDFTGKRIFRKGTVVLIR